MKYGPKFMPIIKELWNNTISPYKNWHKQIKWFSIFIKPNKCQKSRKENKIKKMPTCAHLRPGTVRPSWPAQPTG